MKQHANSFSGTIIHGTISSVSPQMNTALRNVKMTIKGQEPISLETMNSTHYSSTTRPSPRTRPARRQRIVAAEEDEAEAALGDVDAVVVAAVEDDLRSNDTGRDRRSDEKGEKEDGSVKAHHSWSGYDIAMISHFKWNLAFGLFSHKNCMNLNPLGVGIAFW
jgi:small nuclear ribonucleoprotein (snRNP)-like protein